MDIFLRALPGITRMAEGYRHRRFGVVRTFNYIGGSPDHHGLACAVAEHSLRCAQVHGAPAHILAMALPKDTHVVARSVYRLSAAPSNARASETWTH